VPERLRIESRVKIILSRKGFDSSAGGVPSPIFPDSRVLSLPIPDCDSPIRYGDLAWRGKRGVGEIAERLTKGRLNASDGVHIDPDLAPDTLARSRGWRAVLGQTGAAQGHLQNFGVGPGDVFLFFGLFQEVQKLGRDLRFRPDSEPQHVIFGWLQVAEVVPVDRCSRKVMSWAAYHPHMNRDLDSQNTLYVASHRIKLPGHGRLERPGAGVLTHYDPLLRLTAPESAKPSLWLLPKWFFSKGRKTRLSYHGDMTRWKRISGGVMLQSVARGQEFILDADDYPEALDWVAGLIALS